MISYVAGALEGAGYFSGKKPGDNPSNVSGDQGSPREAPTDPSDINPNLFDQFELNSIGPLINNGIVLIMGVMLVWVLLRGNKIIPKRWQAAMESIYNHFGGLVKDNSGAKYFPQLSRHYVWYSVSH